MSQHVLKIFVQHRFIVFIIFSVIGSLFIWHYGTGHVTTTHQLWVPENPRFLNKVDMGESQPFTVFAHQFDSMQPTVLVDMSTMRHIAGSELVDVLITIDSDTTTGHGSSYIHYVITKADIRYHAKDKYELPRLANSIAWDGNSTLTFTSFHYAGAVCCILFWTVCVGITATKINRSTFSESMMAET